MGIKVLPPDVNESDSDYTPRGTDIRFGLCAVRNVGENVVAAIAEARRSKGRFADFHDFCHKVPAIACNKKVVESLIKAGAFDSLGHTRQGLLRVHVEVIDAFLETKRAEAVGQFDLFGGDDAGGTPIVVTTPIPLGEWDKAVLLGFEREMLGLYVSDHPLFGVEHVLVAASDCSVSALTAEAVPDGQVVTVGGIVSSLQRKMSRQGQPWAQAMLEDLEGAVEVLFFPAAYQAVALHLAEDAVLLVKGRLDRREDAPKLIAMEVTVPDLSEGPRGPVVVTMPAQRCTPPVVEKLREILATHPGRTEVHLELQSGARRRVLRLDEHLRVAPTPALMGDLKALLGPGSIR
jgi:DNA polymerase-3 subunit alpha